MKIKISLICVLLAWFPLSAFAQYGVIPAKKQKFDISPIDIPGSDHNMGVKKIVKTSAERFVIFNILETESEGEKLVSCQMDENGTVSPPKLLIHLPNGILGKPEAVWFPKKNHGLLIFAEYTKEEQPLQVQFLAIRFDKTGKPTEKPRAVHWARPPEGQYIGNAFVRIIPGDEGPGVYYFSIFYKQTDDYYGITGSELWFTQGTWAGWSTGIVKIPLPNSGIMRFILPQQGLYLNGYYMLPVVIERFVRVSSPWSYDVTDIVARDLYVSYQNGNIRKQSDHGIRPFDTGTPDNYYSNCQIVPLNGANAVSSAKAKAFLFYGKTTDIPREQEKFASSITTRYLTYLDKKGKKIAAPEEIKIKKWKVNMPFNSNKPLHRYWDRISKLEPLGDGTYVFALTQAFSRKWKAGTAALTKYNYDYQSYMRLLSLDINKGKVKTLARSSHDVQQLFLRNPIAIMDGGRFVVINTSGIYPELTRRYDYISKFEMK